MNQVQIFMPPPANWQDFQTLIADVAKSKYIEDSVQEYGRQGQSQNGVDVYAVDTLEKHIGIQCKETKSSRLKIKNINDEINKAKNFKPALDLFIIATTARIDAGLQSHVNQINSTNTIKFKVQLWFWDDINQFINRSHAVMSSSYKAFQEFFGASEVKNHLGAIRLSFDRNAFTDDFMLERNYQDFEQALVATKAMLKTGFLYDSWSKNLVAQTIPSSMIGDEQYQKFVCKIEASLEAIYQSFLRDVKKEAKSPGHLVERAGHYNIERRKLITVINAKLQEFNLSKINTQYLIS
ncbi:hypothetical protein NJH78_30045 [Pseudomonas chlororaphis]|uniref:hypothetical protein n=1 Tax=Pseudomonas chlororaphis TaxID=587753 RepID=UPI00209B075B|nr:hypothetical protein [Pseudomonas chlororaphis]MCO7574238.1 hypothetical protein [Pseudomonas chlororaphis]MCO7591756.1 hypothetical protein [Pseudomonas chlororaphis]